MEITTKKKQKVRELTDVLHFFFTSKQDLKFKAASLSEMRATHTLDTTGAPHFFLQPEPPLFTDTAASSVSDTSLTVSDWKNTATMLSRRGEVSGAGGALTPTSHSNLSTPTTATSMGGAANHIHDAMQDAEYEGSARVVMSTAAPLSEADSTLQPQPQPRRQWTPRRRSPGNCSSISSSSHNCGDGGVTMVRDDWTWSTRRRPAKTEPRSSSLSRRGSFAASRASTLVPCGGAGEWQSGVLQSSTTTTATTTTARSGSSAADVAHVETPADGTTRDNAPPQRTASWRQLRSHPGGASSRVPSSLSLPDTPSVSPALSRHGSWTSANTSTHWDEREGPDMNDSSESTAATMMRGVWTKADQHSQNASSAPLSGVSSPSVQTPLRSRPASPAVFSSYSNHKNHNGSRLGGPLPTMTLSARELEQMREWQTTAEAQQHDNSNSNSNNNHENVWFGEAAHLPPTAPRASQPAGFNGRLWSGGSNGGGEVLSARSNSVSRASGSSFVSNALQSSLGWRSSAADTNNDRGVPVSSTASSRCLSPVSLSHGWGPGSSVGYAAERNDNSARHGRHTPALLSPVSSAFFPHFLPSDMLACGRGNMVLDDFADASTIEEIEDAKTKRKCVESPTTSPTLTSLSFSIASTSSLAEVLAAQPSRMAVPSEVHLWEQRERRRRRAASPSVARPDDEAEGKKEAVVGIHTGSGSKITCFEQTASALERGPNGACLHDREAAARDNVNGRPLASAASTAATAPSTAPMRSSTATVQLTPPLTGLHSYPHHSPHNQQGRSHGATCDADNSPSLAPLREATVAPSAVVRPGVVVEVGDATHHHEVPGIEEDAREDGGVDAPHSSRAVSLSFCSASEDEPEVDTFALERAQAVMEDADAEAVSALLARQHRQQVHAVSAFAQDLRAHGVHVDPAAWDAEADFDLDQDNAQVTAALPHGNGKDSNDDEEKETRNSFADLTNDSLSTTTPIVTTPLCNPMSPPPVPPASTAINAAATIFSHGSVLRPRCTSSATTAAPSTPPRDRVSGDEGLFRTPPGPKRPLPPPQHVRWSEPEDSEEARTPGSVTTVSSHSLRDLSPPVRERSMAPTELWKERHEV